MSTHTPREQKVRDVRQMVRGSLGMDDKRFEAIARLAQVHGLSRRDIFDGDSNLKEEHERRIAPFLD